MKTLKKIKLNQLSNFELEGRKMRQLTGGEGDCVGPCACGCDQPGGSTTATNRDANNTTYTPYSGFSFDDGFWPDTCVWE